MGIKNDFQVMELQPLGKYYVYELMRLDGSVFYIGKGKGDRINDHFKEVMSGKHSHKCHIIRQIWDSGNSVPCKIVMWTDDEEQAYYVEMELVRLYHKHNLTNITAGGDGVRDSDGSIRAAVSKRMRERYKLHPEYRLLMSGVNVGNKNAAGKHIMTVEGIAALSNKVKLNPPRKGTRQNAETRQAISDKLKLIYSDLETREIMQYKLQKGRGIKK
jgi:hypothetical protein